MAGFWTTTPEGGTVHINGDPNMPEETLNALLGLMDAAAKDIHLSIFDIRDVADFLSQLRFLDDESHHEWIRERASNLYSNLCHIAKEQDTSIPNLLISESHRIRKS